MTFNNIIEGFIKGNKTCTNILYSNISETISNVCRRFSTSTDDLNELRQECFIKLYNNIDKFKGDNFKDLNKWVCIVSRNLCIDSYRKSKKNKETLIDSEKIPDEISEEKSEGLKFKDIEKLLKLLNKTQRDVFELYMLDNQPHSYIEDVLSLSKGSSKSILYKAKLKIKKNINNNG